MKRYIFIISLILVSCHNKSDKSVISTIRDYKKKDTNTLARLELDTKKINVGSISNQTEALFRIKNISAIKYHIDEIVPSCDCVFGFASKKEILPNDTATIILRIYPKLLNGYKGDFSKFVAVIGNSYPVSQNLFVQGVIK